jgi:transcriptional regulator with XRE-family HTH domain
MSETADEAEATVAAIGQRVRRLRVRRGLTLQGLADASSLSPSMLSLVERGLTSPSIGTLVAVAKALGVAMKDLLLDTPLGEDELVVRMADQPEFETPDHVLRRVLCQDRARGVLVTHNEYRPGIGNSATPIVHSGFEYGFVLEGELTVEVDGVSYLLGAGDLITHKSNRPHRIWNYSDRPVRALWFNLNPD